MAELPSERARRRVDLPGRLFLYTIDQIATMIAVSDTSVLHYCFLEGRSVGVPKKDRLLARNIAPVGQPPQWRVAERELIRWLKYKHFRIYENPWGIG